MDPIVTVCSDGSCHCIPSNGMIAMISIINLLTTLIDGFTNRTCYDPSSQSCIDEHVSSLKLFLVTLFRIANVLLLISSIFEIALLIQVYIWYALGYVLLKLLILGVDFIIQFYKRGLKCLAEFILGAVSMFVLCQCLPLVETYRRKLEAQSYVNSFRVKK